MTTSTDSDGYDSGLNFGIELAAEHFSDEHINLLGDGIPRDYKSVRAFLAAEYAAIEVDATAATDTDWERGFLEGVGQIRDAMKSKLKADRRAVA